MVLKATYRTASTIYVMACVTYTSSGTETRYLKMVAGQHRHTNQSTFEVEDSHKSNLQMPHLAVSTIIPSIKHLNGPALLHLKIYWAWAEHLHIEMYTNNIMNHWTRFPD